MLSVATYVNRNGLRVPVAASAELRVLVPIIRAQTAGPLLSIGDGLIRQSRGSGNVLGLVEVPAQASEALAREVTQRRRDLLRWIAATDDAVEPRTTPGLGILVRVVHDVALGIREASYETNANLIVVEWPGLASRRPRLLESVIGNLSANPPADLVLVRPGDTEAPFQGRAGRILVPVRGGPNAKLALRVAAALAAAWQARFAVLHLTDPRHHPDRKAQTSEDLAFLLSQVAAPAPELLDRETANIGAAILEAATGADLVVLGAGADPVQNPALVRSRLATSLKRLTATLLLVRTIESLRPAKPPTNSERQLKRRRKWRSPQVR